MVSGQNRTKIVGGNSLVFSFFTLKGMAFVILVVQKLSGETLHMQQCSVQQEANPKHETPAVNTNTSTSFAPPVLRLLCERRSKAIFFATAQTDGSNQRRSLRRHVRRRRRSPCRRRSRRRRQPWVWLNGKVEFCESRSKARRRCRS